jgi:hypothetical protein
MALWADPPTSSLCFRALFQARTHSPCSSSQREPEGNTMQRKADPNDRDRVQTASREGPSSVSAAVLAVRVALNRSVRSAPTLGSNVPTCLYSTCNAT